MGDQSRGADAASGGSPLDGMTLEQRAQMARDLELVQRIREATVTALTGAMAEAQRDGISQHGSRFATVHIAAGLLKDTGLDLGNMRHAVAWFNNEFERILGDEAKRLHTVAEGKVISKEVNSPAGRA